MRRGTTPTVTLTVTNGDGSPCDLTDADVYVTFREVGGNGFSKTFRDGDDGVDIALEGDASVISITMTQADTLRFHAGRKVRVQVRSKAMGIAQATTIEEFMAEEILLDGEI